MAHIKHRKIRFKKTSEGKSREELVEVLKGLKGVTDARIDHDKKEVSIEYDLLKTSQQEIERLMVDHGFVLDDGIWERFRRGWIHFTEENDRDNLTAKAHSCCEDPTEHHRAG